MGGKRYGQGLDSSEDFRQRQLLPLGEGVGGVAIGAAQITGRQANEDTRQASPSALALHAQVNLVDDQGLGHFWQFTSAYSLMTSHKCGCQRGRIALV